MGWTNPRTWTDGDVVTAPDLDTYVRDNTAALGPIFKKTTAKTVGGTTNETDLFNAELTLAANTLGANSLLRITALGDWKNNAGTTEYPPRWKLSLGSGPTVVIDIGAHGHAYASSSSRMGWRILAECFALGATDSQRWNFRLWVGVPTASVNDGHVFATGDGSCATTNNMMRAEGGNTSAIDMTASQAVVLSVINASSSANYETKLLGAVAEIL